ncbi:MAG: transglycosylase domain-containing protein [Pseudomonadota bacterium]
MRVRWGLIFTTVILTAGAGLLLWEMRTSGMQAKQLSSIAKTLTTNVKSGPSPWIRFPEQGPYDRRLGYSRLPALLHQLQGRGYGISAQARFSPALLDWVALGLFPPYMEKDQAGLRLLDHEGEIIFNARHPQRIYARFSEIPPLIVASLLAIENRELLDANYPKRNPAIEWDRLFRAIFEFPMGIVDKDHNPSGGSTLATQLEKVRHSPDGITRSVQEKLRQVASASLRAYFKGEQTMEMQKRIVVRYLNSLPLAAVPRFGEVIGLAAGLKAWYGEQLDHVNHLLGTPGSHDNEMALAYKQVLSLLLAQRRPTEFLVRNPKALFSLTDAYLRLLAGQGVISFDLRDRALALPLRLEASPMRVPFYGYQEYKTANTLRTQLAALLGLDSLYDLDRLDLTVETTLDDKTQQG